MLADLVWHTTCSHRHIGHDVEAVVASRLQVVNDVTGGVVSNDNLVFFVVQTWQCKETQEKKQRLRKYVGTEDQSKVF